MHFDIDPYLGAPPITFGMQRQVVREILGPPNNSSAIWDKSGFAEHYWPGNFNVGYDNDWIVNHLGFGPGPFRLSIRGQVLWTADDHPDPDPILLSLDPQPVELVGFWFYMGLGVKTSGYHDDDPGQHAVTVFPRGANSKFISKAVRADVSQYLPK